MTDIGKAFAHIAEAINRLHGFGSNKMITGYTVYADSSEIRHGGDEAQYLEQLVEMGYLRKFVTAPYVDNKRRNWRYRATVRGVCFGLTANGWEVAPKYIAVVEKMGAMESAELKAKNYCEKVKDTNPIAFDDALKLAIDGIL